MTKPSSSPSGQLPDALDHLREAHRIIEGYGVTRHDPIEAFTDRGHLNDYVDEGDTLAALEEIIALCACEIQQPKPPHPNWETPDA